MKVPRPFTPEEDARLIEMFEAGIAFNKIGEAIGRYGQVCGARAAMLGLKKRGRPPRPPQIVYSSIPTLPYVPGIIVTGRYQMVAP